MHGAALCPHDSNSAANIYESNDIKKKYNNQSAAVTGMGMEAAFVCPCAAGDKLNNNS